MRGLKGLMLALREGCVASVTVENGGVCSGEKEVEDT